MTLVARRGAREQAPQVPSGRIVLQPPPEITPVRRRERAAAAGGADARLARLDRLRRDVAERPPRLVHRRHVPARLGRLRAGQRGAAAPAAHGRRARRAARVPRVPRRGARHHPRRRGPPARGGAVGLPRPGRAAGHRGRGHPGVGAHGRPTPTSSRCAWAPPSQPLCLTLEPPETPPLAQLDPVAASALHRLLSTHRVQPGLPGLRRPAGVGARRGDRRRRPGPGAGPLGRAVGGDAARARGPRRGGPRVARGPLGVGVAQVAAARAEPARARRRRPGAAGRRVGARPAAAAAAGHRRTTPVRPERAGPRCRTCCSSSTAATCRPATRWSRPTACSASPCSTCPSSGAS